jgi:hypothetical protein
MASGLMADSYRSNDPSSATASWGRSISNRDVTEQFAAAGLDGRFMNVKIKSSIRILPKGTAETRTGRQKTISALEVQRR